jgi:hypothetical protein
LRARRQNVAGDVVVVAGQPAQKSRRLLAWADRQAVGGIFGNWKKSLPRQL